MTSVEKTSTRGSATWGALAVGFFLAHATWHVCLGYPGNALWACHVASLLIGVGGIAGSPTLVIVGLLWLVVGIPLWFYHLAVGGPLVPTSLLTHFGGAVVGCMLLRRSPVPRSGPVVWWRACLALAALVAVTRLVTTRAENVNLAFDIHGRSGTSASEHAQYLLMLAIAVSVIFYVSEFVFRRLFFPTCDTS